MRRGLTRSNRRSRQSEISLKRASLSWFFRFGWLCAIFRTMFFQPQLLGFQPMLQIGSIWTPRFLPKSIRKLTNLFVPIDLRALHDLRSFNFITQPILQIGYCAVKNHRLETLPSSDVNCASFFGAHAAVDYNRRADPRRRSTVDSQRSLALIGHCHPAIKPSKSQTRLE